MAKVLGKLSDEQMEQLRAQRKSSGVGGLLANKIFSSAARKAVEAKKKKAALLTKQLVANERKRAAHEAEQLAARGKRRRRWLRAQAIRDGTEPVEPESKQTSKWIYVRNSRPVSGGLPSLGKRRP